MPSTLPYVMVSGNPKAHLSAAHRQRIEKRFRDIGLPVSISAKIIIDPQAPLDQISVISQREYWPSCLAR